jgi:hypothetical protein
MNILNTIRSGKFLKRILTGALIALFVFTVVGFFVLPPLLKSILIKKLSEQAHREVVIQTIKVNPFVLSMSVKGFAIKDRKSSETFISFDELYVNLQSISLFKRGLIVRELRIERPYIRIVRNEDMSYNFSDILGNKESKSGSQSKPLKFSLNNIQILNGSLDFLDAPKRTSHKVKDVNIRIPFLSNLPYYLDTYVQPSFEARLNDKPIALIGRTKPFARSLETAVDVEIKDLDIPYYLAYLPFELNVQVLSGYLSTKTTISYAQYTDRAPTIKLTGDISLQKIQVVDKKKDPLLSIPMLTLQGTEVDLAKRELTVDQLTTRDGILHVRRLPDGKLDGEKLFTPSSSEGKQTLQTKKDEAEKEWVFTLKKIVAEQYEMTAEDLVPSQPVRVNIGQLKLECENLSTLENSISSLSLSFTVNKSSAFSARGEVGINPVLANLKLNVKGLDVIPLQPYFTDKIKIIVTGGKFSTNGTFSFTYAKGSESKATYRGEAFLSHFSSVDKANTDEFLKWNSLYLNGIDVSYSPLYVKIKGISLTDFYSRLIINPDGTLNIQGIMEERDRKPEEPVSSKKGQDGAAAKKIDTAKIIQIEKVTLQGGTINFSDRYIKPNYSANLLEIGGKVSGLSSEENKLSDVYLKGKLENYAPLEITGKINPLREDLYIDLKIDFKDMDLSPVTPYAGKYIGYTIQKGKLSLDLHYLIVKKKLDSQNNIFFDQLTLGDKVDSPDATKLPVKLAIALLKNRKGEIKLDVPVEGYIDDPKFSIGRIIIKILVNLLAKAATSPFALLGAIFGGGEELSHLEFDYGSTAINEQQQEKLNSLVKALYDRPSLRLEIEGHVDIEKDTEGLRQYLFNKKIKSQKLKEMIKKGLPAIPVDEVKIEKDEYPKYLKKAYKEDRFPKPRNIIGMLKDLPVPEMEKLMLTHIEVKNDDLRMLASQRALRVKDYLLKSKQIEPERIFLIEPKSLQPEKNEKLKDSRIDFRLK